MKLIVLFLLLSATCSAQTITVKQAKKLSGEIVSCIKKNSIFNPAFFNLGPEAQVNFQQGKSIEVLIDKKINEDIRSMSKETFPNL